MTETTEKRSAISISGYLIKERHLPQRILVYVIGLLIAAFGVAFAVNSDLGLSPVQSFPFVLSRITGLSMGTWVKVVLSFFILMQAAILRKEFRPIDVTQIVFAVIFGYFVNFTQFLLGDFRIPTYGGQLTFLFLGMVCIATGIIFYMDAKLVNLPSEGIVAAIAYKLDKPFHIVKIFADSTVVLSALALSLIFLGGLDGVREGTIASSILIGKMIPAIRRIVTPIIAGLGALPDRSVDS
ncbi:MAG: DUF6198 family protein [Oscillospiraceae bacterium]|nr:DUF6198 family protein [Oscillospiraceae bacterium]